MEKLNVGDYVRDKNGIVGKVYDITNEPSVDIGIGIMPEVNAVWIDKDKINYLYQEEITKHSKDIIDIIEVGDYVNGEYVIGFGWFEYDDGTEERTSLTLDKNCQCLQKDIKSVLTKELFESNAYTIEKER